MTDPREPLGRIFHEQGRLTVNDEREKPFGVQPWEGRTEEEKELDMRGASAVAVQALADNDVTALLKELTRYRLKLAALRRLYLDKPGRVADEDALRIIGAEEPCDA